MIISAKKRKSNPVIIAPSMLAAAISTVMSIKEKSIVPKIPAMTNTRVEQTQSYVFSPRNLLKTPRSTARKATAIPKNAQSKGVDTAIPDVSVRSATATPIITLAITARVVQLHRH